MADADLEEVPCNMCGSSKPRAHKLFSKNGLWVTRCRKCHLVYVNPRPVQSRLWERYSEEYFTKEYLPAYGDFNPEANLSRHMGILNAIDRYRQTNCLMDAGCAVGFFLDAARRRGWDVCGVEVSEYAAKYGRERLGLNIVNSTLEDAGLTPGSFDVITLGDTLEHLRDPAGTLRAVSRLLRAGGLAYISTPNFNSLNRLLFGRRWGVIGPTEHIYYFTPRTITQLLTKSGLAPTSVTTGSINTYHYLRGNVDEKVLKVYDAIVRRARPLVEPLIRAFRIGDGLEVFAIKRGYVHARPSSS